MRVGVSVCELPNKSLVDLSVGNSNVIEIKCLLFHFLKSKFYEWVECVS